MVAPAAQPPLPGAVRPSTDKGLVETGSSSSRISDRLVQVWHQRNLLWSLTQRELKVRHRNSIIGVFWNLLQPLLHLTVYSIVFTVILSSGYHRQPLKLLTGLVMLGLFTTTVSSVTTSVTRGGPLLKKIWFPREVLPFSTVAAQFVTFLSRFLVLIAGLVVFQHRPEWSMMWLAPVAILIMVAMATGIGMLLAGLNVLYRDASHFLDMVLMALFWLTPIIYPYDLVASRLIDRFGPSGELLMLVNPLVPVVVTFQRIFYNPSTFDAEQQEKFALMLRPTSWYLQNLAWSALVATVALVVGMRVFARMEQDFADRL